MSHFYRLLILIPALGFMINCGVPKGEFGWATSKTGDLDILEKHIMIITDYKMMRDGLIFSPTDTIHYVYTFSRNPGTETEIYISLNRYELDYVEVDIKKKFAEQESNSIRDEFTGLIAGEYLLKIVHEGETVDEVKFQVLPEEGYTEDTIEQELATDEKDELIKYSR
ncbi:LIC_12238 family plasminogen-binding lipoprotein [Leptospira sp. 'Mane']|uniref:LIC_12238 family plasminogen-binding lipoprotein n=1 Tax=Leptospira sp. 'Mane' TaxID=3387407 RepID=UPI00398AE9D7